MHDIFTALRSDHDRQRALIARLVETTGASSERESTFAALRHELQAHAAAEERHFYVPLMERDLTQDKARHSVAEHKEIDDFIEQLDGYDMSSSQWLITAKELAHRLTHHLDEEEQEVFQLAGRALEDAQKASLGGAYEAEMDHLRRAATA